MQKTAFLKNTRFGGKVQIDRIFETPVSKELRICMAEGNSLKEHSAPGPITIMVLEGAVTVFTEHDTLELQKGEMVYFDANVTHALAASEQSVIRLTLSHHDSANRVISLA